MPTFRKLCLFYVLPFLILSSSFLFYNEIEIFDMIDIDPSTGALCLDGSTYQFYLKRSQNSRNFILFFEGGGWCSDKVFQNTLESCVKRTETYLGSTNYFLNKVFGFFGKYPNFKRWMYFLSDDKTNNPDFHDYNKIILKYCDGRGFVGFNNDPIVHDGKPLYFRGYNNTMEVLNYAKTHLNLENAENLILSGMSAGALASLVYSNYIRGIMADNVIVKTISDSGVFFDFEHIDKKKNYSIGLVWKDLIKFTKPVFPEEFLESYCSFHGEELWKCFMPEYFAGEVKIPVFVIMSLFDSYSIYTFVGDKCRITSDDFCFEKEVELYKNKIMGFYRTFVENKKSWGGFFPGCFLHDYLSFAFDWENDKVKVGGMTLRQAVGHWHRNGKVKLIDSGNGVEENCKGYLGLFYYLAYSNILMDIF